MSKNKKVASVKVIWLDVNYAIKVAMPMNNIWYPDVAAATLGCKFNAINVPMINVPDPTPNIPCTNPAQYPPKHINPKFLIFEKSILLFLPISLYNTYLFFKACLINYKYTTTTSTSTIRLIIYFHEHILI